MAAIAYPTTSVGRPCPGRSPQPPQLRLVPPRSRRQSRRPVSAAQRAVFRRRRIVAVAALLFVTLSFIGAAAVVRVAVGVFGGGPLTSPETPAIRVDPQPAAAASYIVRSGDTLWSIARAMHPSGDLRPYVDQLAARQHGQPLQPGERITLP